MPSPRLSRLAPPALIVLLVGLVMIAGVVLLRPRPEPRPEPEPPPPQVNIVRAQPQNQALPVFTQGVVTPRREIDLISQVSGRIIEVAPQFVSGGFFARDQWLVRVDPRDYQTALARAEARLREAQMALATERGLARQAEREWRDLGNPEANELFLRKPQLAAAQANLEAARAERAQAETDLERTEITVPFDGRIRTTRVDLGQHLSPGTPVAQVFDAAAVQVRLPITHQQAALLDLPLVGQPVSQPPQVILRGALAGDNHQWPGQVTHTEASLDPQSRQIYAVVEVTDPFNTQVHNAPLLVGAFVEAEIAGRTLPNLVQLPLTAVFLRDRIYTLDEHQQVHQKTVRVVHRDQQHIWVQGDLPAGEAVVADRQGYLRPGMTVTVSSSAPSTPHSLTESSNSASGNPAAEANTGSTNNTTNRANSPPRAPAAP